MLSESVREDLEKIIPKSVLFQCTCFVFYDWHPRDDRNIDITVCSAQGELQEFYQKDMISSLIIDYGTNFKKLRILRNYKGQLFYLVEANKQLIIVSSKDKLSIFNRYFHVENYEVSDSECTGEAILKIQLSTSNLMIYLSIDNNFEIMKDTFIRKRTLEGTKMAVSTLGKKLIEAKYNLQCNENALRECITLRQWTYSVQFQEPNGSEQEVQMGILKPIVRFCNKNIVIMLELDNLFTETMDKVHALVHNNSCNSTSYTCKLFEKLPESPFYKEIENQKIKCYAKAVLATVIPIKEFKNSVISRIEFHIVVAYQRQGKDYLQYCDNVNICASEVMGKSYDVFGSNNSDELMVLAMLSATEKTTLCLKQILFNNCSTVTPETLCKHLGMELISKNLAIHKMSSHHILFGLMTIFHDGIRDIKTYEFNFEIDVYTRSTSQVMALIHFMYDSVPFTLIVTTPNIKSISNDAHSQEDSTEDTDKNMKKSYCDKYASILLEQSKITLKYFDDCMKKMNSSKNSDIVNRIGKEIDITAMGFDKFVEYRNKMLDLTEN